VSKYDLSYHKKRFCYFEPFQNYLVDKAREGSLIHSKTVSILKNEFIKEKDNCKLYAEVDGSSEEKFTVSIEFNYEKIKKTTCTCPYIFGGPCKHIISVLLYADELVFQTQIPNLKELKACIVPQADNHLLLKSYNIQKIKESKEFKQIVGIVESSGIARFFTPKIYSGNLNKQHAKLFLEMDYTTSVVELMQTDEGLLLHCDCQKIKTELCIHMKEIFNKRHEHLLKISFDLKERENHLLNQANQKRLEIEGSNLEDIFKITIKNGHVLTDLTINILKFSSENLKRKTSEILQLPILPWEKPKNKFTFVLILEYSRYDGHKAAVSKSGELKSPIEEVPPIELDAMCTKIEEYKFISAVRNWDNQRQNSEYSYANMQSIIANPFQFPFYSFKDDGGKITPNKLSACSIILTNVDAEVFVDETNLFFEISAKFKFDNKTISSQSIKILENTLVKHTTKLYFWNSKSMTLLLNYFQENGNRIFIIKSEFETFKTDFLDALESNVSINYRFHVRTIPSKPIHSSPPFHEPQKRIYLTENDDYIKITPSMIYGETEIPLLSRQSLFIELANGELEEQQRNEWLERTFEKTLRDLHPYFKETTGHSFFYLHRRDFLESAWFLNAFEKLRSENISIFGFAQLSKNKYNPYKLSFEKKVNYSSDWFDLKAKARFGKQEVKLQDIQKALLKQTQYVELGDGSVGILPEEWLEKFGAFFRSADIKGENMHIHKSQYTLIDKLFADEEIDSKVKIELQRFSEQFANFHSISNTKVPHKLKATLRDYQKEGLNWLNFLNEFGFGGCLADDMGLGKTIQIIAYLLALIEKGNTAANLVVLPTSLLFNWKQELEKVAPSLRIFEWYGTNRTIENLNFDSYNIILTTYGTMLADVETLKNHYFDVIILDESQAIKNPQSKRYKAARLLQGRQRIVLTGTPVENNTFDLYAQLSFAMPGLLGTSKYFQDVYSTPIDRYSDTKRAKELRQKIHPFILRRTKKQVAKELPEKTEITLYCHMEAKQRRLYDSYKKEFQLALKGMSDTMYDNNLSLIFKGMMKLRQLCNSPELINDEADYGEESAKINELISQISEKKEEHKILVFSQFVGMLDLIKKKLDTLNIAYCYLTGATRDRQAQVERFQGDDDTRVFLISLKAGGTGLNLTKADYVYIVDPWWNPAAENQAIDRAYRIGQEKNVMAIRMITPDSIEEKVLSLQDKKRALAEDIIHTDTGILKSLKRSDVIQLLE
jgi:SNF2 family DNA or RNA helicase